MKIRKLLSFGLVIAGLMSCSSNDSLPDKPGVTQEGPNMKVVVKLPTKSSSRADGSLSEEGTESENTAKSVLIALYDTNGQLAKIFKQKLVNIESGIYNTETFIAEGIELDKEYKTYLFVNPYSGLEDVLATEKDKGLNSKLPTLTDASVTLKQITSQNEFFMTTANPVNPVKVEATAKNKSTPYHIEAKVERAAARFDFMNTQDENSYTISKVGQPKVTIDMKDAKLLNLSRSLYNLRRTNKSGGVNEEITLGGNEDETNYVVDTDWAEKVGSSDNWSSLFFSPLINSEDFEKNKYIPLVDELDKSESLFYATENTIPKEKENMKGLATAVVFRGLINFNPSDLGVDITKHQPIYVWNNTLYGIFNNLPPGIKAELANGESSTKDEFVKAGVNRYTYDDALKGYPIYYVYYNKHNVTKSSKPENAPMEFAVVRNNVYKLSISAVNMFGHPNDPEDKNPKNPDINPEDPKEPPKVDNIYMDVKCTVLPWIVRNNTIEL